MEKKGLPEEYKTGYSVSIDGEFPFNFKDKEILKISLDVEVIRNSEAARQTIDLKLIPVVDSGSRIVVPGDGV